MTAGRSFLTGSADPTFFGTVNGRSSSWTAEIAYLPFLRVGPSFWPWLNAHVGLNTRFTTGSTAPAAMSTAWAAAPAQTIRCLFLYTWVAF